jgi:hypothetical protein
MAQLGTNKPRSICAKFLQNIGKKYALDILKCRLGHFVCRATQLTQLI